MFRAERDRVERDEHPGSRKCNDNFLQPKENNEIRDLWKKGKGVRGGNR
jgi:hypothetical protein